MSPRLPVTRDELHDSLSHATREIISHFNQSQGSQDEWIRRRFDQVDAKLDAMTEMLAMRQELRSLVRELKAQGITLDESRIFTP